MMKILLAESHEVVHTRKESIIHFSNAANEALKKRNNQNPIIISNMIYRENASSSKSYRTYSTLPMYKLKTLNRYAYTHTHTLWKTFAHKLTFNQLINIYICFFYFPIFLRLFFFVECVCVLSKGISQWGRQYICSSVNKYISYMLQSSEFIGFVCLPLHSV